MKKHIKSSELFDYTPTYLKELFDTSLYPWEIIPKIKEHIISILKNPPDGFKEYSPGILIGKNVKISEKATLTAPLIIGSGTVIRPGAYLRGNVITGENCVLGNSSEYKNSILLSGVQTPHYNYIGDSILGNGAHMGAGSICSNLKADGKDVIIHADSDIKTGLRKLGAFLGDGADIGSGCVLNPGTIIGKGTSIYPLTPLRGVYPENSIVKSANSIVSRVSYEE